MIRLKPKEPYKGLKKTPMKRKPPKVRTAKPKTLRTKTLPRPKKRKGLTIRIDPLDALFSLYVRTRDNFTCQRCGVKSKFVQCAHFIGRRNKATRYDEANCVSLDLGCHQYFHANPLEFVEWTKQRLGEREFNLLQARARVITKLDKTAITIYLWAKLGKLST